MQTDPHELKERMARFEQVCKQAGMKLTHQRIEIFRELARSADHPDVETIHRNVRKRMPTVSLDTVYRNLWMLVDVGLISTLGLQRDRVRFDANVDPHHHFICRSCGKTRDFVSGEFDALSPPRSVREFGEVETTHVELLGICRECSTKGSGKKDK